MDNSLTLNKNILYQLLFALCITVTYLNNYELTFAVWIVTALLTVKKIYSYTLLKYILAFSGIFLIAFIVAFFKEYFVYDYIRDITYLFKPIIGMLVGYQLCKNYNIKPFHTIVYVGLLIAVVHLGIIFHSIVIYKIINIHKLREHSGYFSDFEIYSLVVLMFSRQFRLGFTAKHRWILLIIIGTSSFLYLSRTNFLQLLIFCVAMMGYFRITKRSVTIIGSLVVSVIVLYTILFNINLTRNGKGMEAFLFKVRNAPIEAFKTKVNKDDWQDFNDNYRSYENIITVRQVTREGVSTILFGKGLGSTVDLGRKVWTNDREFMRHILQLHNGFMIVFLKSGLIGSLLHIIFLYYLCREPKTDDPYIKQINRLMLGTGIFTILASWVLMGLYLKIDNKSILIGFLLCYREILIKRQRQEQELLTNG